MLRLSLQADCSTIEARILGQSVTYRLGAPGRHLALNSLAVLAAASLVGADLALSAIALNNLKPASGRGARLVLKVPGGTVLLIDESYNANPASYACRAGPARPGRGRNTGRRIAVLGDMLELGPSGAELHRAIAETVAIERASTSCIAPDHSCVRLWEALPSRVRGGYADTAAQLEPSVLDAIQAGDAMMVKGSLGSKMGPIVKALERKFPGRLRSLRRRRRAEH